MKLLLVVALIGLLTGCDSGSAASPATGTVTAVPSSAVPSSAIPSSAVPTSALPTGAPNSSTAATPAPTETPGDGTNGATAAPSWLGTRVLTIGPDGFGMAGATPKELRNRRIITTDLLPPPDGGRFHSTITGVPADVLERSTWSAACPVTKAQLRYVTLSFVGFDGRAHTGELLINRSAAADVVTVFRKLFAAGWPIEQMRITSPADLTAPPTGDGNVTAAFACRPVRGTQTTWSQHAYGLAIDLDPFDNPYVNGDTVLPELARYYTNRGRGLPGMITPGSLPVKAFRAIGWGWGGNYTSKKDWMHFSSTGG